MILAFDTSSAACTAALFDEAGACLARRDEIIGRGHRERLAPMLDELLAGRKPETILVGVGPGSFTGIRVAIAAAYGLAIGWDAELSGISSLALIAAGIPTNDPLAVAISGGHGELFVQQFARGEPISELANLSPADAAKSTSANLVTGSGARALIAMRGWGEAREMLPSAANAMSVSVKQRSLAARPVYARAPDARPRQAA
jgi:tRNA threonylcarbamoyladenosine biosynthesis protein TsaB